MCLNFVRGETTWWLALFLTCVAGVIGTMLVVGIFGLAKGDKVIGLAKALSCICEITLILSVLGCAASLVGIAGTLAFGLLT